METRLVSCSYARTFRYWYINSTRSSIRTICYKLHLSMQPQCWFSITRSSILPSFFSTTIIAISWKTRSSWYIIFCWERTTKSLTLYAVSVSNVYRFFQSHLSVLQGRSRKRNDWIWLSNFHQPKPGYAQYLGVWINFIYSFLVHNLDSFRLLLFIKKYTFLII